MGNVYMEADQVRFKNSTYHNLQTAVAAALEGGGGGGTTVVANPVGSATADLSKLQVGTTIYGIPADAADISYNNTTSGMTAGDVQDAIDELNAAIPGLATTSAAGLVKPDGTTVTVDANGVLTAVGGGSGSLTPFTLTQNDRLSNVQGGYRVDGDIVTVDLFARLLVEPANTNVFPDLVTSGMDSHIVALPVPKYRTNVYLDMLYLTYDSTDKEYIAYANGFVLIDSYVEGNVNLTHLVLGKYSSLDLSQRDIYIRCYGTYQKR